MVIRFLMLFAFYLSRRNFTYNAYFLQHIPSPEHTKENFFEKVSNNRYPEPSSEPKKELIIKLVISRCALTVQTLSTIYKNTKMPPQSVCRLWPSTVGD